MGYTTYFNGEFNFNKPVAEELRTYINQFSDSRRMCRDNEKIKECYPNWKDLCYRGDLGRNGEYFIGGNGYYGQDSDNSIIDYNSPLPQPGLWCQWIIDDNGNLVWDEAEKFYEYIEWLEYLIKNFFEPEGYILNGEVTYDGEDYDDFGIIKVTDNKVEQIYGRRIYGLNDASTKDLIAELASRGYTVQN